MPLVPSGRLTPSAGLVPSGGPPLTPAVAVDAALSGPRPITDDQYAAAIGDDERALVVDYRIDWDRTGFTHTLADVRPVVEKIHVTRDIAGDLPPAVGLLEGYATTEMNSTLGGTWPQRTAPEGEHVIDLHNYCPVPAPKPTTYLGGWSLYGGSAVRDGAAAMSGMPRATGYRAVATPGAGGFLEVFTPITANIAEPGQPWSGCVTWRCSAPVDQWTVQLVWRAADGTYLTESPDAYNPVPAIPAGTAVPASTARIAPVPVFIGGTELRCVGLAVTLYHLTPGAPVTIEATGCRLDRVFDPALTYGDGDDPDWTWLGLPGAAASVAVDERLTTTQDVATTLSPYRTDSPLTRAGVSVDQAPIEIDTGVRTAAGVRTQRLFTGTLASTKPTSSSRTVAVGGLDVIDSFRSPITRSGAGQFRWIATARGESYRTRFNSQCLVDYVLRQQGVFASPPFRDDAVLACTLHGWTVPEVGSGGNPTDIQISPIPTWLLGPFGMLAPCPGPVGANGRQGVWNLASPLNPAPGSGIGFSAWIQLGTGAGRPGTQCVWMTIPMTAAGTTAILEIGALANGYPYAGISTGSATSASVPGDWPLPATPTYVFCGFHIQFFVGFAYVTWRIDGVTYGPYSIGLPVFASTWLPGQQCTYNLYHSMVLAQFWSAPTPPTKWVGESWIPQADIDPGANEWTGIPDILGEDPVALLRDITAAEFAALGASRRGRPWWRTRVGDVIRGQRPVSEVLDAADQLGDLEPATDESSIRNIVTLSTTALYVGDWTDVVVAQTIDQFVTYPGTTTFELPLSSSVANLPPTGQGYGALNFDDPNASWIYFGPYVEANTTTPTPEVWQKFSDVRYPVMRTRFCAIRYDNPYVLVTNVRVRLTRASPWLLLLTVYNPNTFPVCFATPWTTDGNGSVRPGEPALKIPAQVLEPQDPYVITVSDDGSRARFGDRTYDLSSAGVSAGVARFRQHPGPLYPLGLAVLAETAYPAPVLSAIDLPHDPRRELLDHDEVRDPRGLGSVRARVASIETDIEVAADGSATATDRVTLRALAPPGLGLADDPVLGLADSTAIAG